jgi:hypothetical protein
MPRSSAVLGMALVLFTALNSSAQLVTGTIYNSTTGKPSANDSIVLLEDGQEWTRVQSDSEGTFLIDLGADKVQSRGRVLRVLHGGVSYDKHLSDSSNLNVTVFDSAKTVQGVSGFVSIMQVQIRGNLLEVTELDSIRNSSNPPMTQANPENFRISLPQGAQIKSATVGAPTGESVRVLLDKIADKPGDYAISFPLMPGLTKYVVVYEVPYKGKLVYSRSMQYASDQFSLMLPSTVKIIPLGKRRFQQILNHQGTQVQVFGAVGAGERVAFEFVGAGTLATYLTPAAAPLPSLSSLPQRVHTSMGVAQKPQIKAGVPRRPTTSSSTERLVLVASAAVLLAFACLALTLRKPKVDNMRASKG